MSAIANAATAYALPERQAFKVATKEGLLWKPQEWVLK